MDYYVLGEEEVVLYKGETTCDSFKSAKVELLLTNVAIVFVVRTKRLFQKEEVEVKVFGVDKVKVYNDKPQVKQKGDKVEIYFSNEEYTIQFCSRNEASKFVGQLLNLITGKNSFERGVEKSKQAVSKVDETFGINSVGAVKTIFEKGLMGVLVGKNNSKNKQKSNIASNIAKGILLEGKDSDKKSLSQDEQIETLKKLKELLDAGIITQEEFEKKKKEILKL